MSGSYLSAQPGFLNNNASRRPEEPQSWLARFWAEEFSNPAKLWGNLSVAWSVGFFALGVVFVRKAGWILAPAF
ncbi:uncharacterized protein MJAP1_003049 [Malassezia japonica]|uniref:Uncharacterized protein n=1 Tax=Malassezia japonica TaxID=223818 RepID=A0AAF0JBA8_9BASI|nr:uncharacterized protein MJAP1_003049 [Malassezia japonica]WFD40065.1 hypothetical protein MJAP1_003049 [Malassezia japonica]